MKLAVIGVSEDGKIRAFNRSAEAVFKTKAASVRGRALEDLVVSSSRRELREALSAARTGAPSFPSVTPITRKQHSVALRVGPLHVGGQLLGATVVVLSMGTRSFEATVRSSSPAKRTDEKVLVPGELLEQVFLLRGADLDIDESLFEHFRGPKEALTALLHDIAEGLDETAELVAKLEARRSKWAMLRLEVTANKAFLGAAKSALLRRRAMSIEGSLGYDRINDSEGQGRHRLSLTVNLEALGTQPKGWPSGRWMGRKIRLELKPGFAADAFARRLSSWFVNVVYDSDCDDVVLTIRDHGESSPNVLVLGQGLPSQPTRAELVVVLEDWADRNFA